MYRDVEAQLSRIPGVRAAGLALYNPLTNNWGEGVLVAGKPPAAPGTDRFIVGPRQHALPPGSGREARSRTLLRRERQRAIRERRRGERSVRAALLFAGEDPIDRRFGLNLPENVNTFRIVGIVGDAKFAGFQLDQPGASDVLRPAGADLKSASPLMQRVETASHYVGGILLVTNTPPGILEPLVARTLAAADPNLTVINIRTLEEQVARSFDQQRAVASLAGLFGVIALVLAAIGLYGVTAYTVARRRNEIGLRMALGADRRDVIGVVLGGAFTRVAIGLVLGMPLAVGAGYLLSAQLYGVSFWDPVALSVAAAALALAALVASVVPASRAAALAPMIALVLTRCGSTAKDCCYAIALDSSSASGGSRSSPESDVYDRRAAHAGARHRREHGRLQRCEWRSDQPASLSRARLADQRADAGARCAERTLAQAGE